MSTRDGRVTSVQARSIPEPLQLAGEITAGSLLRAELKARGISQAQLADRTGLSTKHLNQVLQAVVPISITTALLIERAVGVSADLILSLDAAYQTHRERAENRAYSSHHEPWLRQFPQKVLLQKGILTEGPIEDKVEQLLAFFGVASPAAFDRLYAEDALSFRRSAKHKIDPMTTAVWLRLGEKEAQQIDCEDYDKRALKALLPDLPKLTLPPLKDSFALLRNYCAQVGVAVVHVPDIPGTRASAATRWLGPARVMIALTGRGGFEDGLWFSFFHEAGHVVLHPDRRSLIHGDTPGHDDNIDGAELEADDFSRRLLLGNLARHELEAVRSVEEATRLAEYAGVHPGIVAGQVAYIHGGGAWAALRPARRQIAW